MEKARHSDVNFITLPYHIHHTLKIEIEGIFELSVYPCVRLDDIISQKMAIFKMCKF
jgi:hypothetical protein